MLFTIPTNPSNGFNDQSKSSTSVDRNDLIDVSFLLGSPNDQNTTAKTPLFPPPTLPITNVHHHNGNSTVFPSLAGIGDLFDRKREMSKNPPPSKPLDPPFPTTVSQTSYDEDDSDEEERTFQCANLCGFCFGWRRQSRVPPRRRPRASTY